jgi:hypothetical protein
MATNDKRNFTSRNFIFRKGAFNECWKIRCVSCDHPLISSWVPGFTGRLLALYENCLSMLDTM